MSNANFVKVAEALTDNKGNILGIYKEDLSQLPPDADVDLYICLTYTGRNINTGLPMAIRYGNTVTNPAFESPYKVTDVTVTWRTL